MLGEQRVCSSHSKAFTDQVQREPGGTAGCLLPAGLLSVITLILEEAEPGTHGRRAQGHPGGQKLIHLAGKPNPPLKTLAPPVPISLSGRRPGFRLRHV